MLVPPRQGMHRCPQASAIESATTGRSRPAAVSRLAIGVQLDAAQYRHRDVFVRTPLTLDADVAERAKEDAAALGKPFKVVVNEALRLGLDALKARPATAVAYRTEPFDLGLRAGLSYDDVSDLLARVEGDDCR